MTKAAPEASSPEPAVTTPERAGCPRLGCGLGLIAAILVGLLIAQPLVVEEAIIRFGPDGVRRKFLGAPRALRSPAAGLCLRAAVRPG